MAKILFIGDPHLKVTYMDRNEKFLAWVKSVVEEHKPDTVVNLGDSFDTHAVVRSEVLSIFRKHLLDISAISKYIYVVGNHDCVKNSDITRHALLPFKNYDNVTIVDQTTDIDGITYVPYIHNDAEFPMDTLDVCVCHQTIRGVDYGFYIPDSGVDADAVSASLIISGHVHLKQRFGKTFYVGSPYAAGVSDVDQEKGLHLYDTDTKQFEFIPSRLPMWRKRCYSYGAGLLDTMRDEINETDQYVVELDGSKADISKFLNSKPFQAFRKSVSLTIKTNFTDKIKNKRIQIKSVTPVGVLNSYVDKVYAGEIDKNKLKQRIGELF